MVMKRHEKGMPQVQVKAPDTFRTRDSDYLKYHPHKAYEGCYLDCPLPHLTKAEAEEKYDQWMSGNEEIEW